MTRVAMIVAIFLLSSFSWAQTSTPRTAPDSAGAKDKPAGEESEGAGAAGANALLPALAPEPPGKTTLLGGVIGNLDRVLDQMTLYPFGGRRVKVLFDERTKVYRQEEPASQRDLANGQRVHVETVLDGTAIFARSIRILPSAAQGESHGQVVSYDRSSRELVVRDVLSPEPVKFHLAPGASIVRQGQDASTQLTPGALVSVEFQPDRAGNSVAHRVAILATPGTGFTFLGKVAYLDLHAGTLVLVDPRDNKRYELSFNPGGRWSTTLREGAEVTVTADFDGVRYTAKSITVNQPAP
jgi:hypothetical protein